MFNITLDFLAITPEFWPERCRDVRIDKGKEKKEGKDKKDQRRGNKSRVILKIRLGKTKVNFPMKGREGERRRAVSH